MGTFNLFGNKSNDCNNEVRLYDRLNAEHYSQYPYETKDIGEEMALVSQVIMQYWKPRFLLNHNTKCAYEFMDSSETLLTVTHADIAWETLDRLPNMAIECAKRLSFHFPSFIHPFKNGVAEVSWQLNPDGRYFMDDDGFGMTDDEEIKIYGLIDKTGKVIAKFQTINNYDELRMMREQAEKIVKVGETKRLAFLWRLIMD